MPAPLKITFSAEELREMLDYNAETGDFRWKISPAPSVRVGDEAGYRGAAGGKYVMIKYKPYPAARLAWLHAYGTTPYGLVLHVNGDKEDNRLANLKVAKDENSRPEDISLEHLRAELHYDPAEGVFYYKKTRPGKEKVDADGVTNRGGTPRRDGYLQISALGFRYLVHRLAWFYVNGVWPDGYLDHINGDRSDNRIENLRVASPQENARNGGFRNSNTSGFRGVSWDKSRSKWVARIVHNYKQIVIGRFESKEDAAAAYERKSAELHGDFARLN